MRRDREEVWRADHACRAHLVCCGAVRGSGFLLRGDLRTVDDERQRRDSGDKDSPMPTLEGMIATLGSVLSQSSAGA